MNELIAVAFVNKPQGIKGDLKVEPLLDNAENIIKFSTLYTKNGGQLEVTGTYKVGDGYALHLKDVNSVEEAMPYKNQYLYARREQLKDMVGDDKFFISDLINKVAVFDDGESVGIIDDVENYGASDVVMIKSKKYTNLSFANVGGVIMSVDDKVVTLNRQEFFKVCVYDEEEA